MHWALVVPIALGVVVIGIALYFKLKKTPSQNITPGSGPSPTPRPPQPPKPGTSA